MSETATLNPPTWAPWRGLLTWAPFQIDALGLITLLGADEVNASVGRLVRSTWLEYLPLLGAYVIANESFREKKPGYHIYNISQGIHTTDLAPWLSRWIQAQSFEQTRSFVRWTFEQQGNRHLEQFAGISLSFCLIGFLLAMTVLSYDWYGFGNALALFASVFVRTYMVRQLRRSIDEQVFKYVPKDIRMSKSKKPKEAHPLDHGWLGSPQKILIITADARAVTMLIPKELLKPPSPFIARLPPKSRFWYSVMRWVGWIAFAVQVVSLGMAQLATQLLTVVLMVTSTVLFVSKLGCDDSHWRLHIAHTWTRLMRKVTRTKSQSAETSRSSSPDEEKAKPVFRSPNVREDRFQHKYSCWIGKYLKAEVYEWPLNHNYKVDYDEKDEKSGRYLTYDHHGEPSEKRQLLYAWLQLTTEEVVSMDKWDLFPHTRDGNDGGWLKDYEWLSQEIETLQQGGTGQGIARIVKVAEQRQGVVHPAMNTQRSANPDAGHRGDAEPQGPRLRQALIPADDSTTLEPHSPTSPTVTSPEGVTTTTEDNPDDAPHPRPKSAGAPSLAISEDNAAHDAKEAADFALPIPGILRQNTGKFSINSANYVSEKAQDAALRARRRSYGELAFPKMQGREGGRAEEERVMGAKREPVDWSSLDLRKR